MYLILLFSFNYLFLKIGESEKLKYYSGRIRILLLYLAKKDDAAFQNEKVNICILIIKIF